jgi:hypothetical protein
MQNILAQRDLPSDSSKIPTRQRTRRLFCGANANSPAKSGLYFWYCGFIFWLRWGGKIGSRTYIRHRNLRITQYRKRTLH